jgi:ankyrin repeat protein
MAYHLGVSNMYYYLTACKTGDIAFVKEFTTRLNVHITRETNMLAFVSSAKHGRLEIVKYLAGFYEYLIRINSGKRALEISMIYGRTDVAKFLIELINAVIQSNAWIKTDLTCDTNKILIAAFLTSVSLGQIAITKYLVDLIFIDDETLDTAFYNAAFEGHFEVVRYLTNLGPNIYYHNDKALMYAYQNDNVDVLNYILSTFSKQQRYKFLFNRKHYEYYDEYYCEIPPETVEDPCSKTMIINKICQKHNMLKFILKPKSLFYR